jgi:hypothetical protein
MTRHEIQVVTGAGSARTRVQAAAARGLTRFVGRDAETDQLQHALESAGAGRGQVVAVIGEPGLGKSRLFREFTRSWLAAPGGRRGVLCESVRLSAYRSSPARIPRDRIEPRDDARRIREKVTGKLLTLDRALEPYLPALLALVDLPVDDGTWLSLDQSQRRQRTLDGLKRLLLRESQTQPVIAVFEDLHWIDGETEALLDSLVEHRGPCPGRVCGDSCRQRPDACCDSRHAARAQVSPRASAATPTLNRPRPQYLERAAHRLFESLPGPRGLDRPFRRLGDDAMVES